MKLKIYYLMFYLYYLLTIFNPCNQIHQCHKSFSYHLFTNLQPKSKETRSLYNTIVTKNTKYVYYIIQRPIGKPVKVAR